MIILTGPTSSGKTSLGVKLAKKLGAEIISADSRQIYKHLDIGTGKKPISMANSEYVAEDKFWEVEGIKIWMYDVVTPDVEYSSAQYSKEAKALIDEINLPIIVGGTGFYIDSLVSANIDTSVPNNNDIRAELENLSLEELQNRLPKDYFATWNNSEKNNNIRLIRAITIFKSTGEWPNKNRQQIDPSENNLVIELTAPREHFYKRVDLWAETIWPDLLGEVKKIKELGYIDTPPLNGIIYKTAKAFIAGEISESEAIQEIKYDLHSYIRRQQTWFKRYKHSIKVDITEKSFDSNVLSRVESYLNER